MRIPTDRIDAHALIRDRTALDDSALTELRLSIAQNGLRQPIEVFATDDSDTPYGLISGYRRLMAIRALHELTRNDRYAQIDATLRTPATATDALAAMVEENEIRQPLSAWKRGAIAVAARDQGAFDTLDAALAGLYPHASRQKRARLRLVAEVAEALDGQLAEPEDWTECQLTRIAAALRLGWGELISAALAAHDAPEAQWQSLTPLLRECEELVAEHRPTTPNRPRRLSYPRAGLVVRREKTRSGYLLHVTGRDATDVLMDEVLEEIERMFRP